MTAIISAGGIFPQCTVRAGYLRLCGRHLISYAASGAAAAGISDIMAEGFCGGSHDDLPECCVPYSCDDIIADDVIFMRGDMLCGADIAAFLAHHRRSGAEVSVLSVSGNCGGLFIADRKAAEMILSEISFCRSDDESFTGYLRGRFNVSVYESGCYTARADSANSFISMQKALMYGRYIPAEPFAEDAFSRGVPGSSECEPPVYIGKGCIIADGAVISAGASVGDYVYIGRNARVSGAVMNGTYIGEGAEIRGGIVTENARVLSGAVVCENAVVGENMTVPAKTVFTAGMSVVGDETGALFDSEGHICGETNGTVTPSGAVRLGCAAACISGRICIGSDGTQSAGTLAAAFAAGVSAAGSAAVVCEDIPFTALLYAVRISGCGCGCYIRGGNCTDIYICAGDGLPADESVLRQTEQAFRTGVTRHAGAEHFGDISRCENIAGLYRSHLSGLITRVQGDLKVRLTCADRLTYEMCRGILTEKGIFDDSGDNGSIVFNIGGGKISAYTAESGCVFHDRLLMLCIYSRMRYYSGDTAVNSMVPAAADEIAYLYSKTLYRYAKFPDSVKMSAEERSRDDHARKAASGTPFAEDATAVMFTVIDLLMREGISLREAVSRLPVYACAERFVPAYGGAAELLKRYRGSSASADMRGYVRVRPLRSDIGVMISAEAKDSETARELCERVRLDEQR